MTTDAKPPEDSRLNLTALLSALRSPPWRYDEGGQQFSYVTAELAEQAAKAVERLRLERDVLALNFGRKESGVFVVMNGTDVEAVSWLEGQSASQPSPNMPSYCR